MMHDALLLLIGAALLFAGMWLQSFFTSLESSAWLGSPSDDGDLEMVLADFNDALNKLSDLASNLQGRMQAAKDAAVAEANAAHAQDVADTASAVSQAVDAVNAALG